MIWTDRILPGFGGSTDSSCSIFAVEAKDNPFQRPLTKATVAMLKDQYKLIYYIGYPGYEDVCELYDLSNDPEEIQDISKMQQKVALEMKVALETELRCVNAPYQD